MKYELASAKSLHLYDYGIFRITMMARRTTA
jgi:hypothetical protein